MKVVRHIGSICFVFLLYYGLAVILRHWIFNSVVLTVVVNLIMVCCICVYQHFQPKLDNVICSCRFMTDFIMLVLFFVVYFGSQFISTYWYDLLGDSSVALYQSRVNSNPALSIFLTLVLAPVSEELMMRGFVYHHMKQFMKPIVACVVSSLLFAIMHGTMVHIITGTFGGIFFVFVYERYRTILAPIGFHVLNNLVSVVMSSVLYPDWCFSWQMMLISTVCISVVFIYLYEVVYGNGVYVCEKKEML